MFQTHKQTVAILSLALISTLTILPVNAGPKKIKPFQSQGRGHSGRPTQVHPSNSFRTLDSYQKQKLVELFDRERHPLIDAEDHRQIYAQINSLPPGIQKQLRRGKGLPPGLEKKVILDRDLVDYIGVDSNRYEIVVIDSNVVLIERITRIVQDIIYDVFIR